MRDGWRFLWSREPKSSYSYAIPSDGFIQHMQTQWIGASAGGFAAKAQDCTRLHTCKSRSSDYIRIPSSLGDSFFWLSLAVFCRLTFDPCFASSAHFHVIWWDATAAQQNRRILKVHRVHPTKIVIGTLSAGVPRVGETRESPARRPTLLVEKISKTSTSIHKYTQVYGHLCLIYDHRS
jgi:hypothetical protein